MKIVRTPRKKEIRNEIPALLTDDMSISAGAVRLWIKLYNSNRGKNKEAYKEWRPTTNALATILGVKKRNVLNWMKELRDKGWVSTIGERDNTTVIVHYSPIDTKQVQNTSPNATRLGMKNPNKQVQNNAPQQVQNNAPITIKDASAPNGGR